MWPPFPPNYPLNDTCCEQRAGLNPEQHNASSKFIVEQSLKVVNDSDEAIGVVHLALKLDISHKVATSYVVFA